jgi:hypothetical protein
VFIFKMCSLMLPPVYFPFTSFLISELAVALVDPVNWLLIFSRYYVAVAYSGIEPLICSSMVALTTNRHLRWRESIAYVQGNISFLSEHDHAFEQRNQCQIHLHLSPGPLAQWDTVRWWQNRPLQMQILVYTSLATHGNCFHWVLGCSRCSQCICLLKPH